MLLKNLGSLALLTAIASPAFAASDCATASNPKHKLFVWGTATSLNAVWSEEADKIAALEETYEMRELVPGDNQWAPWLPKKETRKLCSRFLIQNPDGSERRYLTEAVAVPHGESLRLLNLQLDAGYLLYESRTVAAADNTVAIKYVRLGLDGQQTVLAQTTVSQNNGLCQETVRLIPSPSGAVLALYQADIRQCRGAPSVDQSRDYDLSVQMLNADGQPLGAAVKLTHRDRLSGPARAPDTNWNLAGDRLLVQTSEGGFEIDANSQVVGVDKVADCRFEPTASGTCDSLGRCLASDYPTIQFNALTPTGSAYARNVSSACR